MSEGCEHPNFLKNTWRRINRNTWEASCGECLGTFRWNGEERHLEEVSADVLREWDCNHYAVDAVTNEEGGLDCGKCGYPLLV